ncbi:MAG: zf-HC2 domain-containing protein [Actinomycetota bacterium]
MTARPDPYAQDAGAYVLGALDPAARLEFERHLRACAECSRSVTELAGLPALLATVPRDVAEQLGEEDVTEPAPPGLLDAVLARVDHARGTRRHRRLLFVAAAAVALLAAVVGGVVAARDGEAPDVRTVALQETVDGPLAVTARMEQVAWGTRIELDCRYEAAASPYATPPVYALVVRDDSGNVEQVATWRAVPGRDVTVQAATAVPRDRIAALEVRTSDGRTVLTADW